VTATVEVLVVGSTPPLDERLAAAMAEGGAVEAVRLSRADGSHGVAERVAGGVDVVLLALPEAERGILPLIELRATVPEVPVVVIANAADEPLAVKALQMGAADYLVAERLYGTLLARCVLHAVETERVRARLRKIEAEWQQPLRGSGDAEGTAASLRAALPKSFEELTEDYGRLLDQAVEQLVYRVEHPLEAQARRLARRAGELRAGPRDIVEIHAAVLKARRREVGPQRMRLYVAEGQVRLLELMGHLVTYYRRLSAFGMRSS
jgi:DNA-binding NarL/FixJ family response regulator